MSTNAASSVDLTNCDREPIQVPGSIQPHGVLLVVREPDLVVQHASESVTAHLGRRVDEVVGAPLAAVIDASSLDLVRAALTTTRLSDVNPIHVTTAGASFDALIHRHDGLTFLELEPRGPQRKVTREAVLRLSLGDVQSAATVAEVCDAVVATVRRLTGFERVMLYRFDEDGHGCVEAEAREPSLEPYLGLHYPASDIPRQARELYLRNWLRLIPDARYTPSPLVPAVQRDSGAPVDLTFAVLRSVSPIHLEYLANMGVRAAMSISLVVRGALWGLVSCLDHSAPRHVSYELRAACEVLGRLVSVQIAALDEREQAAAREAHRASTNVLASAMAGASEHADVLDPLVAHPGELLSLVDAEGAAVVHEDVIMTCGRVPEPAAIGEIAAWLEQRSENVPFATTSLATDFPAALAAKEVASGLLAVSLPGSPARRVLWFRPEMVRNVLWGGDPNKPAAAGAHGHLHPRKSFEKWKEEVHLRSCAWTNSDLDAARDLRRRAVEIDLERQLMRARHAVRVRDDLVAVVSHDLKNPLSVIQMQTALLLNSTVRAQDEPVRRLRAGAERTQRAIDRMNALITDLLDLAKIEAGRFELSRRPETVRDVLVEAIVMVRPLAEAKHIAIDESIDESCVASVDRERFFQVVSNILGNAIKFTPEDGRITVESDATVGELRVSIADTGPGIPADAMEHVFDRYWQAPRAKRAKRRTGSGLGLYIAKGIVEAHGGRIWVDRAATGGAKFRFTIPCERV